MHRTRAPRALARGALALLCVGLLSGAGSARSRSHVVQITGFAFVPARVTVAVGDTITWVNQDIVPHTATAARGAWDSGMIAAKGRGTAVIRAGGHVDYQCTLHPSMKGTVVVE
jgi:plastocyanin